MLFLTKKWARNTNVNLSWFVLGIDLVKRGFKHCFAIHKFINGDIDYINLPDKSGDAQQNQTCAI